MKITPTLEVFIEKSKSGNLIPVWGELLADMETPVSAYRKLGGGGESFLLESVEQGEKIGRYSFIGFDPVARIQSRGETVKFTSRAGEASEVEIPNPIDYLRDFMARYKPVADPELPPFIGGAVGYLAYDLARRFEVLPDDNDDDLQLPDMDLLIADSVVAFDHLRRRILIIQNAHVDEANGDGVEAAYKAAVEKIRDIAIRLKTPLPSVELSIEIQTNGTAARPKALTSNTPPERYKEIVDRAKEYILAGDIFQVVLSQRFATPYEGDPFDIYRALRAVNPSPYMFYIDYGDMKLAGASPEVLVTVEDGEVRLRPIAGTKPRGKDESEDLALEKELLEDPKECAEHIMLVDLGRNDCGRVSEAGSVVVTELMVTERYSHVMHIVSHVVGKLKASCDGFDALEAALPAGTLSGAPKIRAMEIIDELETVRRGPYGGACGYFGFNGNVDLCITIRTVLITGGKAYIQVGAGIVADSVAETELQETENKAGAMLNALAMAEAGLD